MKIYIKDVSYENSYPLKRGDVFEAVVEKNENGVKEYNFDLEGELFFIGDEEEINDGSIVIVADNIEAVNVDIVKKRIKDNQEKTRVQNEPTITELIGD